jgi:hypothetical protein
MKFHHFQRLWIYFLHILNNFFQTINYLLHFLQKTNIYTIKGIKC